MSLDINTVDTSKNIIEKNVSYEINKNNNELQTKKVHDILWTKVLKEGKEQKYPKGIEVTFIEKNVFLVVDKNKQIPKIFTNKEGSVILSMIYRKDEEGIKNNKNGNPGKAMIKSGFVFGENLELHKIVGYENGSLIIKGKVDTYSKEYYNAWKKIIKASGDIFVHTILNSQNTTKFHHNSFDALLNSGAITKEILEKINNKGILTTDDYKFGLDFLRKQEDKEKAKTHIDEAIENINSRLNGIVVEIA